MKSKTTIEIASEQNTPRRQFERFIIQRYAEAAFETHRRMSEDGISLDDPRRIFILPKNIFDEAKKFGLNTFYGLKVVSEEH